jgi:two-component system sensor histidine kinase SenX3
LGSLIEDMMSLSILDTADHSSFEPVDIVEVTDRAIARTLEAAHKKSIEIRHTKQHHAVVLGDTRALATAVENLINNAIYYSRRGSRVTVTTRLDHAEGEATISVIDQGIGIAPEDQERVFERFYRTDAARSQRATGTGLGLSIVKNTALSHGGRATVDSMPDQGSTFAITLPLLQAPAEPPAKPKRKKSKDES